MTHVMMMFCFLASFRSPIGYDNVLLNKLIVVM